MWNMEHNYDSYLNSFESSSDRNTYKSMLKDFDFSDVRKWSDESFIIQEFKHIHPKSTMAVKTRKSIIKKFFNYCLENVSDKDEEIALLRAVVALHEISGTTIFNATKDRETKRFISNHELKTIINLADTRWDDPNAHYYSALFLAIYEGFYTDADFEVIKNARASDISGNTITLRDKDNTYKLDISDDLKQRLLSISQETVAYRANRYGYFEVPIVGDYYDTIFKTEQRKGKKENVEHVYRGKLRKVIEQFMDFDITPKALYVSGLMWKIKTVLEENGYSLEDAFGETPPTKTIMDLIRPVMLNHNYLSDVSVLKMNIKDNLKDFG